MRRRGIRWRDTCRGERIFWVITLLILFPITWPGWLIWVWFKMIKPTRLGRWLTEVPVDVDHELQTILEKQR